MPKWIIENGIKVYKNRYCHCPCHQRIPVKESHRKNGIPKYIWGHHNTKSENFERRINVLLEPIIIKNGVKYYKNYYCKCSCGGKILYPTTKSGFFNHKYRGIPEYIHGHDFTDKQHTKESKDKISNALIGKPRKPFTEATLLKMSKAQSGKYVSEETREKLSKTHSGKKSHWYGKPPAKNSGYGKRCHYNSPLQGKVCFRSTYELKYAKYLDKKGILWKYEHKTFELSNCTTYTPDFFLVKNKKYREIKGYMTEKAQEKIDLFQEEYNRNFKVLYREDLINKGITF